MSLFAPRINSTITELPFLKMFPSLQGARCLVTLCLLQLTAISLGDAHDQVGENMTSTGQPLAKLLVQAAPYALESKDQPNGPSGANRTDQPVGSRDQGHIEKLLEALSTGESVQIRHENNKSTLNLTLKNEVADELATSFLVLSEILEEASQANNWKSNTSSVIKDNHKFSTRSPPRSKPIAPTTHMIDQLLTVPPIRRTIDVVAENYTARKIANEANIFALKLLHQLNIEKLGGANLVQSPFAVYQGLALLLSGAHGDTAKELDRVLLGSQSVYENTKLTHDQDRARLLASLGDSIRQLYAFATNHWAQCNNYTNECLNDSTGPFNGGTTNQHLIIANNLLFSNGAYEISGEFKTHLASYYNNTALTKIEVGSTESIQIVNAWIRRATVGLIPAIFHKRQTFDEFNVMTMLSTSWLAQEWRDTFHRVSSSLHMGIKLKGQNTPIIGQSEAFGFYSRDGEALMEFVDDSKVSHFVEFIKSVPTKNIQHYHTTLSGQAVDVVVVPYKDTNHRMIALTPILKEQTVNSNVIKELILPSQQPLNITSQTDTGNNSTNDSSSEDLRAPDSSSLSRLLAALASSPRSALKSLWNTVNPEIITKQTLSNIQIPKPRGDDNSTLEHVLVSRIPPRVQLSIPLINTGADSSISAALNHIGVVNTFDPSQANLIGINGHPFNYNKLHLSNVISKTTFNLNERGVNYDRTIKTLESLRIHPGRRTSSKRGDGGGPELEDMFQYELVDDVRLDRPFLYMIVDFKTNLILYTGVLRDPARHDLQ